MTAQPQAPIRLALVDQARVVPTRVGSVFSYALRVESEIPNGRSFLTVFHLEVGAPIQVIGVPPGWDYSTDGSTFVDWFNTDTEMPYPHDVAPGAALEGFTIESTVTTTAELACGFLFWDHLTDGPAPPSVSITIVPFQRPCPADFNGVGGVTVQDLFDFLAAWFSGKLIADFDGSGSVTVQDLFDYLAAWFAGCA